MPKIDTIKVPIRIETAAPDPVEQMTARIAQLNETLRLIEEAGKNPLNQSKQEREDRRALRCEVYGELERCFAPPVEFRVAPNRVELTGGPVSVE